jgi:hypothetical protein
MGSIRRERKAAENAGPSFGKHKKRQENAAVKGVFRS